VTRPGYLLWDLDGTLVRWSTWRVIPSVALRFLRGYSRTHGFWRALTALAPAYRKMLTRRGDEGPLNRVFLEEMARRLDDDPDALERQALEIVERDLGYLQEWIHPIAAGLHAYHGLLATGHYQMVAATNPTMPQRFNELRLGWAGYDPSRFALVTGTEVCVSVKHRPGYYQGLLDHLGVAPEECLMIGNDAKKDLPAALVGIPVFLLTTGHHQPSGAPAGVAPVATGGYPALRRYLGEGP
jgi:FMN phosphatase YigB (HAD superfamily)